MLTLQLENFMISEIKNDVGIGLGDKQSGRIAVRILLNQAAGRIGSLFGDSQGLKNPNPAVITGTAAAAAALKKFLRDSIDFRNADDFGLWSVDIL